MLAEITAGKIFVPFNGGTKVRTSLISTEKIDELINRNSTVNGFWNVDRYL